MSYAPCPLLFPSFLLVQSPGEKYLDQTDNVCVILRCRIGNQDVADAVAYVVDKYTHDGLLAAAGQINCQHPSGATELDWSVQKSDL